MAKSKRTTSRPVARIEVTAIEAAPPKGVKIRDSGLWIHVTAAPSRLIQLGIITPEMLPGSVGQPKTCGLGVDPAGREIRVFPSTKTHRAAIRRIDRDLRSSAPTPEAGPYGDCLPSFWSQAQPMVRPYNATQDNPDAQLMALALRCDAASNLLRLASAEIAKKSFANPRLTRGSSRLSRALGDMAVAKATIANLSAALQHMIDMGDDEDDDSGPDGGRPEPPRPATPLAVG